MYELQIICCKDQQLQRSMLRYSESMMEISKMGTEIKIRQKINKYVNLQKYNKNIIVSVQ